MKDAKKNEELQSRREFFKKAAKGALPIIAAAVMASAPAVVKAANTPMDCYSGCVYGCEGGCNDSCYGSCKGGCNASCIQGNCAYFCTGSCKGSCSGSCSSYNY